MFITIFCLMFIGFMPYMASTVGGYYRVRQKGNYDIVNPRRQASQLEGAGERAQHLQLNCWEALILFAVALFSTVLAEVPIQYVSTLSVVFVVIRLIYFFAYMANWAKLRVGAFVFGLMCCLGLFSLALHESFA